VVVDVAEYLRNDWNRSDPVYCAFDLLWLNGSDYREKPLLHRKAVLRQIVPSGSPCVLHDTEIMERGVDLFRVACERNLEGIVAKHRDSVYGDGVGSGNCVRFFPEILSGLVA